MKVTMWSGGNGHYGIRVGAACQYHRQATRSWNGSALLVLLVFIAFAMPARSQTRSLPPVDTLVNRLGGSDSLSASRMLQMCGNSAIPALKRACRSGNWQVRYRSIATLGQLDASDAVKEETFRLLHDPDWRVRISAIVACRQALNSDADDFLSERAHERCAKVRCVIDSIPSDKKYRVGKKIVATLDGDDWRSECLTRWTSIQQRMVKVGSQRLLLSVTNNFDWDGAKRRACRACALFMVGSRVKQQELVWPGNCGPISLAEDKSSARPVRLGRSSLLMVLANDLDSGTWDCVTPLFFHYRRGNWAAVQHNPKPFTFSCHGGFALHGNCCRVFDFDYTDGSYSEPQPYVLHRYYFRNGAFHAARTLYTKHKYTSPNQRGTRGPCPASEDPLHEFGLRWSFDP